MSNDEQDNDQTISKTRLKKQMTELQQLGESLITLTPKQYNGIDLPEQLRSAVDAAREMTKRGALHRQRQYIGKLMRNLDPEPIRAALDKIANQDRIAARLFHRVETMRENLLDTDNDDAVTQLCAQYPAVDRQTLRQKVRAARREAQTGKPVGAKRALFRFLDALMRAAS